MIGARSGPSHANLVRRAGNQALNAVAGYLAERSIADLTSGFRAAARDGLLEFLHLLPNGFSTPTTTTLAFIKAGYSVRFEPIEAAKRQGQSKIRLGADGVRFLLILLKVVTIFSPLRIFLPVSGAAFLLGASYAVWTIVTQSHVTNSSVLLILMSVVILLVGLVSEQISALALRGAAIVSSPSALVIVPTYNERENLPIVVEQLLRHANVRVLVVDDQSPDGTGAIADDLARQYRGPRRGHAPHRPARSRPLVRGRFQGGACRRRRRHLSDGRRPVARSRAPAGRSSRQPPTPISSWARGTWRTARSSTGPCDGCS